MSKKRNKLLPSCTRDEELAIISSYLETNGAKLCPGALTKEFSSLPLLYFNHRTKLVGRKGETEQ